MKTSVTQKEKSKGICMEGYLEKYHFLQFLRIHNYPQPVHAPIASCYFLNLIAFIISIETEALLFSPWLNLY